VAFAETITYTYDDAGQVIKAEYQDGTEVDYIYDPAGNLVSKIVNNVFMDRERGHRRGGHSCI
jgi:YD repeat-containing protein